MGAGRASVVNRSKPATKIGKLTDISLPQARRIALAAQGFTDRRPSGTPDLRVAATGAGPNRAPADRLRERAGPRALPAALQPPRPVPGRAARPGVEHRARSSCSSTGRMWPRSCRSAPSRSCAGGWRSPYEAWGSIRSIKEQRPDLLLRVLDEIAERGPLTAGEIEHDVPRADRQLGLELERGQAGAGVPLLLR